MADEPDNALQEEDAPTAPVLQEEIPLQADSAPLPEVKPAPIPEPKNPIASAVAASLPRMVALRLAGPLGGVAVDSVKLAASDQDACTRKGAAAGLVVDLAFAAGGFAGVAVNAITGASLKLELKVTADCIAERKEKESKGDLLAVAAAARPYTAVTQEPLPEVIAPGTTPTGPEDAPLQR